MPTYTPYVAEVGHLRTEEVCAIDVPRADFLRAFESVLEDQFYADTADDLRAQLTPVASTMDRFPVGNWFDADRGCGCVVGEYLIAADLVAREEVGSHSSPSAVDKLLGETPLGEALFAFGSDIDTEITKTVKRTLGFPEAETLDDIPSIGEIAYPFHEVTRDIVLMIVDEEAPDA